MFIIIPALFQLILDILIFAYLPKKSHYEIDYLNTIVYDYYIRNSDDFYINFFYNNSFTIDKILRELINPKKINQAILAFAIILFIIFFLLFFAKIILKCKDECLSEEQLVFFMVLIAISFIFLFINWSMALAIVVKS